MNTKHPKTKFTSEFEKMTLSISYVKITRSNNKLDTSIFCKTTFSGVFTNFKTYLAVACKFGLVYTLLYGSFFICFFL